MFPLVTDVLIDVQWRGVRESASELCWKVVQENLLPKHIVNVSQCA